MALDMTVHQTTESLSGVEALSSRYLVTQPLSQDTPAFLANWRLSLHF
jgi:hypothetical protein